MNAWEFMAGNPWLSVFLICAVVYLVCGIINRCIRHLNIRTQGWPPAHCDADGDFKDESE